MNESGVAWNKKVADTRRKTASLREYRKKRRFARTPEPAGGKPKKTEGRSFVVQKHAARRLHYDFRLEFEGVLKSWAVPKGPSLDPGDKRLAVEVEDHPLEYGDFEGTIPEGEYGGGTVVLWDRGRWQPKGDAAKDLRRGRLKFELEGEKLRGGWMLVRMPDASRDSKRNWLLIKERDSAAEKGAQADVAARQPLSVASGRSIEEVALANDRTWESDRPVRETDKPLAARVRKAKAKTKAQSIDPSSLPDARKANQPSTLRPQLATLVKAVPAGDEWLHEMKFDGYRLLCFLEDARARLITRNGLDWTDRFGRIAKAASSLPVSHAVLDGEVVVQKPDGTTDFQALQNVLEGRNEQNLLYYAFDLPYCEGYDLTRSPLAERKRLLERIISQSTAKQPFAIRYSEHIVGHGPQVFAKACSLALEGIVSKKADSPYEPRRTHTWTKSKCVQQQEFVIGGYTDPSGARTGFGALLVGLYDDAGKLVYCGRVGTGFDDATLSQLYATLKSKTITQAPFRNPPRGYDAKGVHWVSPDLVAQVEFGSWTNDGMLRHPSFEGLRKDKDPKQVKREIAAPTPDGEASGSDSASKPPRSHRKPAKLRRAKTANETIGTSRSASRSRRSKSERVVVAGVKLTNPDRVLYPGQHVTKQELALFYESIADWVLPHVVRRPLSVVRCPAGHDKECFFQKHVTSMMGEHIRGVEVREKNKDESRRYIVIDDLSGLISLVQLGVLEFHPWASRDDDIERPDRLVFDLDPGPEVTWSDVIQAAIRVRGRLAELGLESFAKNSGGKGLHVVVPLQRRSTWDQLKAFAEAVAVGIAADSPDRYLVTATKSKRTGRIFIDYLRNARGATSVAAYSTRARAGAPVSTPLAWDEITPKIGPAEFNIHNLPNRLQKLRRDPWAGFFETRQSLTAAMMRQAQAEK